MFLIDRLLLATLQVKVAFIEVEHSEPEGKISLSAQLGFYIL